jgi:hypothetical protein
MIRKSDPWYVHAALYVVIVGLIYLLIYVAIIEPTEVINRETYYKNESRARMDNIRQAQILWEERYETYSDNLDSLIHFIKTDTGVVNTVLGFDSITMRSTNPFVDLTAIEPFVNDSGDTIFSFNPDSLFVSPKSHRRFIVKVDTTVDIDTVINRRGRIVKIDTIVTTGQRYVIENPDSKDRIGDLFSDALKNTASWE